MIVHFARCRIVDLYSDQLRVYTKLCGEDGDPLGGWWTVNPELITCERCRERARQFVPEWIKIMKNFRPV
jgi:hypothetical protein